MFHVRTVIPLDAAGGIITTADDMTRWLEFQLNTGRDAAGNQLLPVSYWLQMHSPQMAFPQSRSPIVRPWFPASDTYTAYGLGWRLGLYRGMSTLDQGCLILSHKLGGRQMAILAVRHGTTVA